MAKGPGRNAPCPCGSGRKYKNCCLAADEARERAARAAAAPTASVWDVPDDDLLDEEDDDEAAFAFPGAPASARDERLAAAQDDLWERFEGADYETQLALFQEALQGEALDADLAFEMLADIQAEAERRGELARFAALLDQFAREAPGFYEEDAAYYAAWSIESAIACGDLARLPAALEPFARDPAGGIDELFRVADQLLYYDQTAPLLDMLRRGWEPLNDAPLLLQQAFEDYAALMADLIVCEYARTSPAPRADDPALARQLAAFLPDEAVTHYQENAAALLGTLGRAWQARDFESPPRAEPRERRITLLGWEWAGDLWRAHGAPPGRTFLAGQTLVEFQIEGAAKGKSAQAMLLPARRRLERFLKEQCDELDYREYRAGALVELLPLYPAFLTARGLLDAGAARRALADWRPLYENFLRKLAADRDDPAIAAAIRARWASV
ncbi:MAG TPA: SEC-C domain-containing protein [Chloroflexota bacterium]|nr:SEC-C domain-containing protein [Chloroflexota bacterium]